MLGEVCWPKKFRLRSGSCQSWEKKAKNILIRSNVKIKHQRMKKTLEAAVKSICLIPRFLKLNQFLALFKLDRRPQPYIFIFKKFTSRKPVCSCEILFRGIWTKSVFWSTIIAWRWLNVPLPKRRKEFFIILFNFKSFLPTSWPLIRTSKP